MARMTLEEIRTRASTVNREKVEATTETEIEAHRAADGNADLDVTDGAHAVEPPKALRVRLGMTQPEIATALSIPLGTWRNWEQGRVNLEPAASALLRIVSHSPEIAFAVLCPAEVGQGWRANPVIAARRCTVQAAALAALSHASADEKVDSAEATLEAIERALNLDMLAQGRHG